MNNTEEKFYECFNIKPTRNLFPYGEVFYTPRPITDRILLELICIVSGIYPVTINCRENIDELKSFILRFCIRHKDEFDVKQVQALFEEE